MGVVSAVLKFAKVDWYLYDWNAPGASGASAAELIAIVPLVAICAYMIFAALRERRKA